MGHCPHPTRVLGHVQKTDQSRITPLDQDFLWSYRYLLVFYLRISIVLHWSDWRYVRQEQSTIDFIFHSSYFVSLCRCWRLIRNVLPVVLYDIIRTYWHCAVSRFSMFDWYDRCLDQQIEQRFRFRNLGYLFLSWQYYRFVALSGYYELPRQVGIPNVLHRCRLYGAFSIDLQIFYFKSS